MAFADCYLIYFDCCYYSLFIEMFLFVGAKIINFLEKTYCRFICKFTIFNIFENIRYTGVFKGNNN